MEIRTFQNNRFSMDYFSFGDKEKTMLILPGLSLTSVMDSREAIKQAYQSFCDYYTVYTFERINIMPHGYSIKDMAKDLAEVLISLNLSKCDIFGASQGGMIALQLAIDYPELVNKIVIGSSLARGNSVSNEILASWVNLAQKGNVEDLNNACYKKIYGVNYYQQYKEVFDSLAHIGTKEQLARFAISAQAALEFNCYEQLNKIQAECLVIGSNKDEVLSPLGSQEIAEKLGCEIYMYDGYSHAVYDQADDYKVRILTFFQ